MLKMHTHEFRNMVRQSIRIGRYRIRSLNPHPFLSFPPYTGLSTPWGILLMSFGVVGLTGDMASSSSSPSRSLELGDPTSVSVSELMEALLSTRLCRDDSKRRVIDWEGGVEGFDVKDRREDYSDEGEQGRHDAG
jgi:hypothetical protein